ncbi:hypothetical protein [Georgenia subflava]|uniref:Uncharacterized protein n=1 Tax=Georgenia subflava TaxID=1622177 RepID=A0A6N7EFC6_9MICO|nr:hypothetical protein [Georgenia subflava]MPV37112.1 hypothetical protein [Georgenia subflava]
MSETQSDSAEVELMKRLGIESWRNLSKDKFMTFVSDLPNMDREVALKVVAQFPNFKDLVLDTFKQVEEEATRARTFNWKSQKKVHKAFEQYRQILSRELEREDSSSEDRFVILGLLKDAIDAEATKDSENKKFQLIVTGMLTTAALALAGTALAALGGRAQIGGGGDVNPSA